MEALAFLVLITITWLKLVCETLFVLIGSRKRGLSKRSPLGWRSFFSKARHSSQGSLTKTRKASTPSIVIAVSLILIYLQT